MWGVKRGAIRGGSESGTEEDDESSDEEGGSDQETGSKDANPFSTIALDDEVSLWVALMQACNTWLMRSEKSRLKLLQEATVEFFLPRVQLDALVRLNLGAVHLPRLLPPDVRGELPDEEEALVLSRDSLSGNMTARPAPASAKKNKLQATSLKTGEYTRAILTLWDILARTVSPLFSVWGSRYVVGFMEYMDKGYMWSSYLAAEISVRVEIGKLMRKESRRLVVKKMPTTLLSDWRATMLQVLTVKLAKSALPRAGAGKKQE